MSPPRASLAGAIHRCPRIRKTQAERRERLAAEGFTPDEIARIHGPIGLDLGGRAPVETALAILAEMTKVRYGR